MFKSERKFADLDDFFGTSNNNSLTGLQTIKGRIADLDKIYEDWKFNMWNFTEDYEERQFLFNEVYESIEIMRSSSVNYIIGEFNPSIIASSEGVEIICNVILYLEFIKNGVPCTYKKVDPDWRVVNTAIGPKYYDNRWNKVVKIGQDWAIYKHNTLNPDTLKAVEKSGFSCNYLLNAGDTLDKNVFIDRRNASAHGDFSRILIIEQLHGYVVNAVNDMVKLMNNRTASLDQYTKASNFMVNVIKEFNNKYRHS
jgi:hypothetical protein